MLKEWLKKNIMRWLVQQFTCENLKTILLRCVDFLKVKSYETENVIDDWAIQIFEDIVKDDAKISIIYGWLSQFITSFDDNEGRCCLRNPNKADEKALVETLLDVNNEKGVCQAIPASTWETVLQMILPFLIDWFRGYLNQRD